MSRSCTGPLAVIAMCLSLAACGGDKGADVPQDAGDPTGSGVVQRVKGIVVEQPPGTPGLGNLKMKVVLGEQDVTDKVRVSLSFEGQGEASAGTGPGHKVFELAPGLYGASLEYQESARLESVGGAISGLKVNAGSTTSYKVYLEVPVGLLQVTFKQMDSSGELVVIDDQVTLAVYAAGADPSNPVWEGSAGSEVALNVGSYDVRASLPGKDGTPVLEWYRGLKVEGNMALSAHEMSVEAEDAGVRVDVFNFGREVNAKSQVVFFRPGADVQTSKALHSSLGGKVSMPAPGTYDVLVSYAPAMEVEGKKLIEDFVVPVEGGVRHQIDVEMELGVIRVAVFDGEADVSDRVNLVVKRAGADPVAGTSILDAVGVSEHFVAVGTYDLYLTYLPESGEKKSQVFKALAIANGAVWEQRFEAAEQWVAVPAKNPAEPLRPIGWQDPAAEEENPSADDDDSSGGGADDDDSSASDDDDSAGAGSDDDDSSATPSAGEDSPAAPAADPAEVQPGADGAEEPGGDSPAEEGSAAPAKSSELSPEDKQPGEVNIAPGEIELVPEQSPDKPAAPSPDKASEPAAGEAGSSEEGSTEPRDGN